MDDIVWRPRCMIKSRDQDETRWMIKSRDQDG